jgi:hypothetical protein
VQPGGRADLPIDHETARVALRVILDGDQPPVRGPAWRAFDQLDPRIGGDLVDHVRRAAFAGNDPHFHAALVPALDGEGQRRAGRPSDAGQVRQGIAVPGDLDAAAVEADDSEADVGVGGAGGRVA